MIVHVHFHVGRARNVETVFAALEKIGALAGKIVPDQKRFPVQKIVNVDRIIVAKVLKLATN
jgi:hypothetical protein